MKFDTEDLSLVEWKNTKRVGEIGDKEEKAVQLLTEIERIEKDRKCLISKDRNQQWKQKD